MFATSTATESVVRANEFSMQMMLLIVVTFSLAIAVVILYVLNAGRRRSLLSDRSPISVDEIAAREFSSLDPAEFRYLWARLADALDIKPELLRPQDPLSLYLPKHLPELTVDSIEAFLEEHGVREKEVVPSTSISELVFMLYRGRLANKGTEIASRPESFSIFYWTWFFIATASLARAHYGFYSDFQPIFIANLVLPRIFFLLIFAGVVRSVSSRSIESRLFLASVLISLVLPEFWASHSVVTVLLLLSWCLAVLAMLAVYCNRTTSVKRESDREASTRIQRGNNLYLLAEILAVLIFVIAVWWITGGLK